MVYNSFQELKLSALGLGAMRLPVMEGDDSRIDEAESQRLVDYAMEQGINFYDTAWGYHGGNSETVLGKLLSKYPRESYCLATKFPGYDPENFTKVEEIFEEQLKKCGVEYFDFYFFHNVTEKNIDNYLNKAYGVFAFLKKQKELGRIKHLGFSAHGGLKTMRRFLAAYGPHMEFGMIQLNYLDYTFQQAREKIALLSEYDVPVWVMEPLRGGKLAALPQEYAQRLRAIRPEETIPGWAFRFLQSLPEVTVTLSGMSNFQQLRDNIRTYETHAPLNREEMDAILGVADEMLKQKTVPCTGCKYCLNYCEQELDIPGLLGIYNEHSVTGGGFLAESALAALPEEKRPQACIGCKKCEEVCPQEIKISETLADFAEKLK
ncbi:MAG: aldo/keto reductase [Ruminiclostridium sp.]|nr:aldo/keto reductase [Ruminiclostridium sp.]